MQISPKLSLSPELPLSRPDFISLLNTAQAVSEWRYTRRLCTAWLASFPGDLPVRFNHAWSIVQDKDLNSPGQALAILDQLCSLDPEYTQAQELLADLRSHEGLESHDIPKGCAHALNNDLQHVSSIGDPTPIWAHQLYEARTALAKFKKGDQGSLGKAEHAIHQALVENPDTPLAAVTHLSVMVSKPDLPPQAKLSLAQIYNARWPDCLQFSLILADLLMSSGESTQAVELLHQVVAKDVTAQVAKRMWGKEHAYQPLWPEVIVISSSTLNSPQSLPVPAAVAARLGWNQLSAETTFIPDITAQPQGTKSSSATTPANSHNITLELSQPITKSIPVPRKKAAPSLSEPVKAVQIEFNRLAKTLNHPGLVSQDGRFPVYVIFTTRKGLETQYGAQGAELLDIELKKLAREIRGRRINHENWGAILFYADDPEYTSYFDLKPVSHNDPWALKLLLADLEQSLGKGGERIGAILIVGGPEIVPFHRLPNPVDDADPDVLSDNPYTSLGENYFIQEWQVGRLPGGSSNDAAVLLSTIRSLIKRYEDNHKQKPWYRRILDLIEKLIRSKTGQLQANFGYSAAVWRRASLAVYRMIGNPQELVVSPPVHACEIESSGSSQSPPAEINEDNDSCLILPGARLAYFNLHGIPDSAFWYGQRDPTEPLPGMEFPVAIRPQDVRNGGSAPHVVFSEACYGAHITGKNLEDALSLKFLASGSHAVVGSTCISYGSISTPLSAADLLGRIFWSLLEEGLTAGEALRRSKLHLVQEMHRRQGYLDPEDQKTIISFVLYGDPLAQVFEPRRNPKSIYRRNNLPTTIHTISEYQQPASQPAPISPEIVAHVKNIVAQYLPGMSDAQVHLTQANPVIADLASTAPVSSPGSIPKAETVRAHLTDRRVVSLSKNICQANLNHSMYARLTLDSSGKLLKLTVSR